MTDSDHDEHNDLEDAMQSEKNHSVRLLGIARSSSSKKDTATNTGDGKTVERTLSEDTHDKEKERKVFYYKIAMGASWTVNIFLLAVKLYVAIESSSKAVLASLIDSAVDILTQTILTLAEVFAAKRSPNYPVGRSRLEALSVVACAFIMCASALDVIQFSAIEVDAGINGNIPEITLNYTLYIILGVGIFMKFFLWLFCLNINKFVQSDGIGALAEDHFNDIFSNSAAIATAAISFNTIAWWVDPVGAIAISLVVIIRWIGIIREQVKKIVGHTVPPEFIEMVEKLANEHDKRLQVDCTRVYHFGARYNVELEVVLPGDMTVAESHDLALALQDRIERLDDVERAFVNVDHQHRTGLEHKIERELWSMSKHVKREPVAPNPSDNRLRHSLTL